MSEKPEKLMKISNGQGDCLVALARKTIAERLGKDVPSEIETKLNKHITDSELLVRAGTFVTLTINDNLRGCIGSLADADSVIDGITKNSVNAAFNDYRFSKLTEQELAEISIEISILTPSIILNYLDSTDLLKKLRVGIDGVIIKKGVSSATFLPQVWQQLPKVEDFLTHLCTKAGLNSDAWLTDTLEVSTYQVQHFSE